MGMDKRKQFLRDFIKVGRSGSKYYVYGAPIDMIGPHNSADEANVVFNSIIDNWQDYDVIDRKVVKKEL